jgi:hypothetical protein
MHLSVKQIVRRLSILFVTYDYPFVVFKLFWYPNILSCLAKTQQIPIAFSMHCFFLNIKPSFNCFFINGQRTVTKQNGKALLFAISKQVLWKYNVNYRVGIKWKIKNTTLSEQFQWVVMWEEVSGHVEGSERSCGRKWAIMWEEVTGVCIDFPSFYDFDILFWNCSDSVVFFIFHFIPTL